MWKFKCEKIILARANNLNLPKPHLKFELRQSVSWNLNVEASHLQLLNNKAMFPDHSGKKVEM